jgi:RHS repeat-associated protein
VLLVVVLTTSLLGLVAVAEPASVSAAEPVPVTEVNDAAAAMVAAQAQGSKVEVLDERTESSQTFANADGSFTLESSTVPERVQRADGSWVGIDTTLVQDGGSWTPRAVPDEMAFSNGGSNPFADMRFEGGEKLALKWPGGLPEPTVEGSTLTYPDVVAGGDLVVTALPTGFSHSIVLRDQPAADLRLEFPIVLRDTTIAENRTESLLVKDDAGSRLLTAPEPLMWDARLEADVPQSVQVVESSIDTSGAKPTLVLTPDPKVLADPATEYPVTIDPTFTASGDTWVQNADYTTGQTGSAELRAGTYDGGSHKARSFLHFNDGLNELVGTQILSATFRLRNFYSYSCNSAPIKVSRITDSWQGQSLTWNNQPGVTGAGSDTFSQAFGYGGSCASADNAEWNVKDIVQGWADDSFPNYGLRVKADDESDSNTWRKYRSLSATQGFPPKLIVTYNRYPNKPSSLTWSPKSVDDGTHYTTSLRPEFSVKVSDPDSSQVRAHFEIKQGSNVIDTGNGPWVNSGKTSSWKVPASTLTDGTTYTVKAWAKDGDTDSKNFVSDTFKVDTSAPNAPSGLAADVCQQDAWAASPSSGEATFNWTGGADHFRYWLDDAQPRPVYASQISVDFADGEHTFHVQSQDPAGNTSATVEFSCTVGTALVDGDGQPLTGKQVTVGTDADVDLIPLKLVGGQGSTARFEYRKGSTGDWTVIPDTALSSAQPAALTATTGGWVQSDTIEWTVRATETNLRDGLIQVRGCVDAVTGQPCPTGSNTKRVNVRLDSTGAGWAPVPAGPGSISLRSGNLSLSGPSAGVGGLTVDGVHDSNSAAIDGPFGPGWSVSALGAVYGQLVDTGTQLELTDSDGAQHVYAVNGSDYTAVGEEDDLTITTTTDTGGSTVFLVEDQFGDKLRFSRTTAGSAAASESNPVTYTVTQITDPVGLLGTVEYNSAGHPETLFDTNPPGANCPSSWAAGCRKLSLTYSTVAGNERVSAIGVHVAGNGGSTTDTDVACFSYDSQGRLASWWDPRTASTTCNPASPVLPTSYGYDSSDRIVSVTDPGQAAWQYTYDTLGRVATVSRAHSQTFGGGTSTTTFAYNVDISATTASDDSHPDLSETQIANWGQTSVPVYAAAVFPPGVSTSDLRNANVIALDNAGEETNTAAYSGTGQAGWQINTLNYNDSGVVTSELAPSNRVLALTADAAAKEALGVSVDATSVDVANALSTTYLLDDDGYTITDIFEPLHPVALPDGTVTPARAHTQLTPGTVDFDPQNLPQNFDATDDGPEGLVTEQTTTASLSADADPSADQVDARTTRYDYGLNSSDLSGWKQYTPVRTTTVVPGGTNVVDEVVIDPSTGRTSQVRQPSAAAGTGNGSDTTRFVHYTSGTNSADSACGNKPAWDGFVCTQGVGGQPGVTGLPGLVTTRVTNYDALGRATTVVDSVVNASGATKTRTTNSVYDGPGGLAARLKSIEVIGTVGKAVPKVTYGYHSSSGLPSTITSDSSAGADLAGVLTSQYDDFGNTTSFTDADGATTQYVYDSADRASQVTYQDAQASTIGTSNYAYGSSTDRRGLLSSVTHSGVGGAMTAGYNADGDVIEQSYPDGLSLSIAYDPIGDATFLEYVKGGNTFLSDSQVSDVHGQWQTESGVLLPYQRDYSYDAAGRLTTVADTDTTGAGGGCTTRSYGFDQNSNRTSKTTYAPAVDGTCSTTGSSTSINYSYDSGDRLQPTGQHASMTYDAFGRTTTLPAVDNDGSNTATVNYYVTDMVAGTHRGSGDRNWTLDPFMRLRSMTAESGNQLATTNHYSDPASDSPSWTQDTTSTGTSSVSRMLQGPAGNLAAVVTGNTVKWQLAGLHGDIIRTTSPSATVVPDGNLIVSDEYGNTTSNSRYGYLGQAQRANDDLTSLTYMGVRMYAPAMGRFLQTDPVIGGNETTYGYPVDPVNDEDPTGLLSKHVRIAYRYMTNHGFSAKIASAIIGNLMVESYRWLDRKAFDGSARGIAQWEGDRWESVTDFAQKRFGDTRKYPTFRHQLIYLVHDLKNEHRWVLDWMRKGKKGITRMTVIFQNQYEQCGDCDQAQRIKYARRVWGSRRVPGPI